MNHPASTPAVTTDATVFVVDDDASFRQAISRLLRANGRRVEAFASAAEFLARLHTPPSPAGCALIDLNMPEQDGLELQATLARSRHPLPIVFLTGRGDIPSSVRAMRHGAEDFLTKLGPQEAVLAAVDRALQRHVREQAERDQRQAILDRLDRLTPREHEVLRAVLQGALNKQIAATLAIDERSVKRHRTSFMAKLGVDCVARLVELIHAAGYPSPKGR